MEYVFLFINIIIYVASTVFFFKKANKCFHGEISFSLYFVYLFLYIGIFIISVIPFFSSEKFFFLLITYGIMCFFDFLCRLYDKIIYGKANKKYAVLYDRISRGRAVAEKDPQNWGALSELALLYFKTEEYEKAIETQRKVLEIRDRHEEKAKLDSYIKYFEKVREKKIKCWFCGKMAGEYDEICPKCGNKIKYGSFLLNKYEKFSKYGFFKFLFIIIFLFFILNAFFYFEPLAVFAYWIFAVLISFIYIMAVMKKN